MRRLSSIRHVCAAVLVAVPLLTASAIIGPVDAAAASSAEQQMAAMVNDFRAAHGKGPLTVDAGMSADARAWSGHMAGAGLAHDPNYTRSCDRFAGYTSCAENVGYSGGGVGAVQQMLQASSGHRANMLCDCTHMGIGVVDSGGRTYATQRFVGGGSAAPAASATVPPPISPSVASALAYIQATSAHRYLEAAYPDFVERPPSASDLAHWTPRLRSAADRDVFVGALAYSGEAVSSLVGDYYEDILGRPVDAAGSIHWTRLIRRRAVTPADFAAHLYASPERFADENGDLAGWVDGLYRSLLDRPSDDAGQAHWVAIAQRHGRAAVSRSFYDSAESLRVRIDDAYRRLLDRPADPGGLAHWAGVLRATGDDVALTRSLATSAEYVARAERS